MHRRWACEWRVDWLWLWPWVGQVVVSGLARGIDAAAHDAALTTGTVAAQAGGVDVIYPAENADLTAQIFAQGCHMSEQPVGMQPQTRYFPLRNRIISGHARAVVVVEAAAKLGSLIIAETALKQGRGVFAVLGHPFDARAEGCNRLIRDGATLLREPQDIFDVLGIVGKVLQRPDPADQALYEPPAGPIPPRRPWATRRPCMRRYWHGLARRPWLRIS